MDKLKEGVLAIGAGFAPHDWARRRIRRRTIKLDMLAVALHLQLLEIGREAPEPLVVRDHPVRGVTENIAVPDAEQPHQNRDVPLHRRLAEVLVDFITAAEKFIEAVWPDRDRKRQPDAGPDRITAANPVPEAKHTRRLDAKLRHFVELRRDGGEVV